MMRLAQQLHYYEVMDATQSRNFEVDNTVTRLLAQLLLGASVPRRTSRGYPRRVPITRKAHAITPSTGTISSKGAAWAAAWAVISDALPPES